LKKLFDIQELIKSGLDSDAQFIADTIAHFGSQFKTYIDKSEINSINELPALIIHKNFSSSTPEGEIYALQLNFIAFLGDYVGDRYESIKNIEDLAHKAIDIVDMSICKQVGVHRTTTNMFLAAPIDGSDDIEWVVSLGYTSLQDNFI